MKAAKWVNNPGASISFPGNVVYDASPAAAWTWYDIDISAIVGQRRAFVLLKLIMDPLGAASIRFRENGEAANSTATGAHYTNPNADQFGYAVCFTDIAGILEFAVSNNALTYTISVEVAVI